MSYYTAHVFFCLNQRPEGHELGCCASKGAEPIFNYVKARVKELKLENVRINRAGCLDACQAGPVVVVYPQAIWYRIPTVEQAEVFIQQHLVKGDVAQSLRITER